MKGPLLQFAVLLDAVKIVKSQNTNACSPEKLLFLNLTSNSVIILTE